MPFDRAVTRSDRPHRVIIRWGFLFGMPMANSQSIAFPAWFRWVISVVLPGAVLWATFISIQVMKVPDIARAVERTDTRSVENTQNVAVVNSQYAELKRLLIRIEDKIDKRHE